jgi:hypothetical protein
MKNIFISCNSGRTLLIVQKFSMKAGIEPDSKLYNNESGSIFNQCLYVYARVKHEWMLMEQSN